MTFSDALPVQFWPVSADTFNEKELQGVFNKCFCQPWNCDDEITVQFTALSSGVYSLLATNEDGGIVYDGVFTEHVIPGSINSIYSLSFQPSDEGFCDDFVSLQIFGVNGAGIDAGVPDPTFIFSGGWTNVDNGGIDWSWNPSYWYVTLATSESSDYLRSDPFTQIPANAQLTVSFDLLQGGEPGPTGTFRFDAYGWNGVTRQHIGSVVGTGADPSLTITGVISIAFDQLEIVATDVGSGTDMNVTGVSMTYGTLTELAKSDCLDIKPDHKETVLINYYDTRNFAGLVYSSATPDIDFNIRVPGVFFHERFPEESEVIELSNSRSIQLNGQVKAQKRLDLGFMPYYMHRKLKLILKHQFVTIDDEQWVQSETYEIAEGNKKYPLKKATVWLDEKDYIKRNVL